VTNPVWTDEENVEMVKRIFHNPQRVWLHFNGAAISYSGISF
jgi:hypothetical protein